MAAVKKEEDGQVDMTNEAEQSNGHVVKEEGEDAQMDGEDDSELHKSRVNKLTYLLQRSQIYSKIMADKMQKEKEQRQQKEKREEQQQQQQKQQQQSNGHSATAQTQRRSARSGKADNKQDDAAGEDTSTAKSAPQKPSKRRNEGEKYKVSDYLNKTDVEEARAAAPSKSDSAIDNVTTSFQQPALITGATLREYQLYGVEWLVGLYENGLNGILADEMGLGKTLQTISLFAHLKSKQQWGPFLVVCPASTLQNWMDEIARFAPDMRALLYYSSDKKQRAKWIQQYRKEPKTAKEKLEYPIFVTSYELAINDARQLGGMRWKFIVVDEGHRLKNRNARLTRELKSYFSANRLILTGTPVHNNLAELWSLLNFILPDVFDNLDEFESWFDFSDLQSEGGSARILSRERSQNIIAQLRDILDPFILQREKKNVEKDLPPKKEYMLYAPLTAQQRDLYEEVLNNSLRARLMEMMTGFTWDECKAAGVMTAGEGWDEPLHGHSNGKKGGSSSNGVNSAGPSSGASTPSKRGRAQLEPMSTAPRKAARKSRASNVTYDDEDETEKQFMDRMETGKSSKRSSRRNSFNSDDGQDPSIRMRMMRLDVERQSKEHAIKQAQKEIANMRLHNPIMQLRKLCGHPFLLYWPKDPHSGELLANKALVRASGKMMMLNRLLDALWARNHKVLLFSQFTTMLDIIEEWCIDTKKVEPLRIDGNVVVSERSKLMKTFNTDKSANACKLFLLSTRAGGLGVNLVAADTVIFYDTDWNPQVDRQAQDRAHRIGQTKPVLVFRLVTRDTAEERIVKRAFAKQQLSTLVLSGDQFSKQTNDAASAFAAGKRGSRVEEWAALLEELKQESVQFEIADEKTEMISDAQLDELLDRSPAVFEKRALGWKGDAAAANKTKGAAKEGKAVFEVTDVLDDIERDENGAGRLSESDVES